MPFPGNGKGAGRVKGRLSCVGVHGGTGSSERRETAGRNGDGADAGRALLQSAEEQAGGREESRLRGKRRRWDEERLEGPAARIDQRRTRNIVREGVARARAAGSVEGTDLGCSSRRTQDRALGRNRGLTRERCTGAAGRADVASPVAACWVHFGPGRSPDGFEQHLGLSQPTLPKHRKFLPPHTQLDPYSNVNIYDRGPVTTGAVVKDTDKKKTGQKKSPEKGKEKSAGRVHGGCQHGAAILVRLQPQ
ncbi:hypothetical protein V8E53_008788 [Lactarius tabidus]